MKAAVFVADNQIELQNLPDPKPQANEVIIKIGLCGVCGTDSHIFSGELRVAKPPVVLGHEVCGTIIELGKNVTGFEMGQYVSIDPVVACGQCEFCHTGRPNLCPDQTVIGYIRNGGFAQYTAVPATHLYPVSQDIGFKGGILVETLACVLHGYDRLNPQAGKTALVLGAGTVGLLWSQLLRRSPITKLIQTEIVEFRRKLAGDLAADVVIDPEYDYLAEAVYEICPEGVDYIIDATGDPEAVEEAVPLVAKSGTFMIFGVCPENETINISPNLVYQKEMKIIASKMPPGTLDRSAKLLESGMIDFERIVNTTLPLDRISEALAMFRIAKDKVVKMAIDPWQ